MHDLSSLAGILSPFRDQLLLIGGFAVNHHGYTRNTLDLDLMVSDDTVSGLHQALRDGGYLPIRESAVAVFFESPDTGMRVDVLPVDATTFSRLATAAETCELSETFSLPTPSLVHLLAMKLHALRQNPEAREDKDLPDIAWLCVLNGLDPAVTLKPLCEQYGTPELYARLQDRIRALSR